MNSTGNGAAGNLTNELAKERTREAADRTLNASIRTSIVLIGFGFAIAKSYEYVETGYRRSLGRVLDPYHAPLWFGAALIILGLVGTVAAIVQYGWILDKVDYLHMRNAIERRKHWRLCC